MQFYCKPFLQFRYTDDGHLLCVPGQVLHPVQQYERTNFIPIIMDMLGDWHPRAIAFQVA